MRTRIAAHPRLWMALIALAFASLIPLAFLQYRWIGQISDTDRDRRQTQLEHASSDFASDFEERISRLQSALGGPGLDGKAEVAKRLDNLRQWNADPKMLRRVLLVTREDNGLRLEEYENGSWHQIEWPSDLATMQELFNSGPRFGRSFPDDPSFFFVPHHRPHPGERFESALIGQLDIEYLQQQVLPELAARFLSPDRDPQIAVRVVDGRDQGRVIFSSATGLPAHFFDVPDVQTPIRWRRARFFEQREPHGGRSGPPPLRWRGEHGPPPGPPPGMGWQLQAKYRPGSVETLTAQARGRNLAVSFLLILLMAGCLTLLILTLRDAQRLGRMQLEFVAGVSHELRTPLAVICATSENLADGVITDAAKVRRYGSIIGKEGKRLSNMVEQLMRFARLSGAKAEAERGPASLAHILDEALARSRSEIEAAQCTVDKVIDPNLPEVLAEPTSLTYAFRNLIENAITHGGQSKRIGLQATAAGNQVEVTVEDEGPGIEKNDLPHVFEPFYRGRRALDEQIHGFGLGLSLTRRIVEGHGGSISVSSAPGAGTRFTVRVPAVGAA